MIPVNIQCGCGQLNSFEVEPLHGQMPAPVQCPHCRADHTGVANQIIAQHLATTPPPAPARPGTTVQKGPPPPPASARPPVAPVPRSGQKSKLLIPVIIVAVIFALAAGGGGVWFWSSHRKNDLEAKSSVS